MFCEVCGKELKEGMSFCSVCGSPVGNGGSGVVNGESPVNNTDLSGTENSEIMQDPHRQQRTRVTYNADNYTNNNASYNSRNNAVRNNTNGDRSRNDSASNRRTNSNVTYNSMNNSGRNVGSSRNGSSNGKASGQGMSASKKKYAVKLVAIISAIVILFGSVGGYFIWRSKNRKIEAYFKPFTYEDIIFPETGDAYIRNELILKAAKKASFKNIKKMVEEAAGEIVGYISISNDYQVEFSDEKDQEELSDIIDQWTGNALVASVDFHYVYESDGSIYDYTHDEWWDYTKGDKPDDFEEDWNIYAPNGNNWGVESVWMPLVWEKDVDFSDIKVGIIDTVFDDDHPDLTDRFKKLENNPAFIDYEQGTNSATDADDTNTPADADDTNTPTDAENLYHGTHVAGIIGANIDDGIGVAGVAQNSELYGFSVTDTEGNIYTSIMEWKYAIVSQLLEGVKAINISMDLNPVDADAIDEFNDELGDFITICADNKFDFLIVKAAENENSTCPGFITGITNDAARNRIIIVGGAEPVYSAEGKLTGYKAIVENENLPKDYYDNIDIYAPGKEVDSDVPGGLTENHDGNSVAAPFVTGEAALIWGINEKLSAFDVKDIILENYIYTVTVYDATRPYANAYLAVEAAIATKDKHYEAPDVPTSTDAVIDKPDDNVQGNTTETADVELSEHDILEAELKADVKYMNYAAVDPITTGLPAGWSNYSDHVEIDFGYSSAGIISAQFGDFTNNGREELIEIWNDESNILHTRIYYVDEFGSVVLLDESMLPLYIAFGSTNDDIIGWADGGKVIETDENKNWGKTIGYAQRNSFDSYCKLYTDVLDDRRNIKVEIGIVKAENDTYLVMGTQDDDNYYYPIWSFYRITAEGFKDISTVNYYEAGNAIEPNYECTVNISELMVESFCNYYMYIKNGQNVSDVNYIDLDDYEGATNRMKEARSETFKTRGLDILESPECLDDENVKAMMLTCIYSNADSESGNATFRIEDRTKNLSDISWWRTDTGTEDDDTTEEAVVDDSSDTDDKGWKQAYLDFLNGFVKDEEKSSEGISHYYNPEKAFTDKNGDFYASYEVGEIQANQYISEVDLPFNIIYLDEDGVPEIVLRNIYYSNTSDDCLLTYKDGQIFAFRLDGDVIDYCEKEGLIACSSWGSWSQNGTTIYSFKDRRVTEELNYGIDTGKFYWMTGEFDYDKIDDNVSSEELNNEYEQGYRESHNYRYYLSKYYSRDNYEEYDMENDAMSFEEIIDYLSK